MTNIASTCKTKTVVDHGAVPALVRNLRHHNPDLREQCAWCLGNIAGDCAVSFFWFCRLRLFGFIRPAFARPAPVHTAGYFTRMGIHPSHRIFGRIGWFILHYRHIAIPTTLLCPPRKSVPSKYSRFSRFDMHTRSRGRTIGTKKKEAFFLFFYHRPRVVYYLLALLACLPLPLSTSLPPSRPTCQP